MNIYQLFFYGKPFVASEKQTMIIMRKTSMVHDLSLTTQVMESMAQPKLQI